MSQAAVAPPDVSPSPAPRPQPGPLLQLLSAVASLRLTVVLFVLAILLVFFGTLAQVDEGIWTVLQKYFRTLLAWIPFQALVRFGQVFFGVAEGTELKGSFPFPGGWLIGGAMLINLLAAHLVRFKTSWKRSGIIMLHLGLILLMVGEFITGVWSIEGRMTIPNGGTSNFLEDHHKTELAILLPTDERTDSVVVIPQALLKKGGTIKDPNLPFDIEVVRYMVNSGSPQPVKPDDQNAATAGDGLKFQVAPLNEVSGTDPNQPVDMASAYLTFKRKDNGQSLGTFLVSTWWSDYWVARFVERPQKVDVDGKTYEAVLRAQRSYKPYTITLKEFRHDLYPGTTIPKNFSSKVELNDPSRSEQREALIYMNEPMRHAGETFFQSGWIPGDKGTILQVVYNPGALLPYISCALVTLGLLIHFGITLVGFLNRRAVK